MTDVPAAARGPLAEALLPRLLTAEREYRCDQGQTRKTLWRAFDGAYVESVLMRYPGRVTMCVSSQAGCGMACPFCATGQAGLTRNLSAAEIVAQVVAGARALARGEVPGGPGRVSNVVFMGMGEPLANYSRVLAAVRRITDPVPDGLGISRRAVTVSTVGLVPAIGRLAGEGLPVRLAVSLHAPDDELRDELVPVNRRWKVAEVLDAAWEYAGGDRAAGVDRVRADPRHQRPGLARRRARRPARRAPGAREPDPAQPDAGVEVDRVRARRDAGVRAAAGAAGHPGDRPRHPRDRDRRCLRPAGRRGPAPARSLAAALSSCAVTGSRAVASPQQVPLSAMSWRRALGRWRRAARSRAVHAAWRAMQRAGTITAESPAGRRFAAFGPGSMMAFPTGAVFGERWIEIGDGTMIAEQVTLCAGMMPGHDLGDRPVLRVGDRCVIGRGSHIVAHHSIVIGDDVFTGPYVYITDQNHSYADPDVPIGRQWPVNTAVSIGAGTWLGAGSHHPARRPRSAGTLSWRPGRWFAGQFPTGAWWPAFRPGLSGSMSAGPAGPGRQSDVA